MIYQINIQSIRNEIRDHRRVAETSRQIRQIQFYLQNLAVKLTTGRASSVLSEPCRIFSTIFPSCISNLVHISLMFFISKVRFSPLNDSILSVTTIFLSAHFPKNCDRLRTDPSILKRSTFSSACRRLTGHQSKISFWTSTFEKRKQRSSLMSLWINTLNLVSTERLLRKSSQVNQIHFLQSSQTTFILVNLLTLKLHPVFSN